MNNEFTDTELAGERWKAIEGYDGLYEVSDLGRVRSKHTGEWKVRRASKDKDGYLQLLLSKNGKIKRFLIHRLVAQAFIPNDDESKTQINHRNECKSDNRLWNLEWCSAQYNSTYNDIHHRRIAKRDNYIRPKIEKLYNPNLSIKQNIELFKSNGIECSECTIVRLRKDLNLKHKSNYKVNKIKDLYRPELTIKQNIALFKEHGIDCSKSTVIKLRKDLGLTKTD